MKAFVVTQGGSIEPSEPRYVEKVTNERKQLNVHKVTAQMAVDWVTSSPPRVP